MFAKNVLFVVFFMTYRMYIKVTQLFLIDNRRLYEQGQMFTKKKRDI